MSSEPVDQGNSGNSQGSGHDTRILNIDSLHLHSNEIDSLNRLAQTDPELARIVVKQKDRFDKREHGSYRFGVISALMLATVALVSLSFVLIELGVVATLLLIFGIMVIALLLRVLLTGEWSETSWIGHFVTGIVSLLGGKPKDT
ncbi:hypothetical protein [Sulfitobacter sp. 1A12056]|uniref:hypothetical protein n=1 Tax=Sulfitobacter sp. 1A12056 TaxID=3368592 RepID=UPI00374A5EEB